MTLDLGLSPRSRGSLHGPLDPPPGEGSIPALAGKPSCSRGLGPPAAVYPRARGEAVPGHRGAQNSRGLSPRSRGSPEDVRVAVIEVGSIPALAGKPWPRIRQVPASKVYPRARGEAIARNSVRWVDAGLSPRSRGSPSLRALDDTRTGSIPALAGKPGTRRLHACSGWVYPRARGEAEPSDVAGRDVGGLSPRSRGSRAKSVCVVEIQRSIPALAGKPCSGTPISLHGQVYPRARGEA